MNKNQVAGVVVLYNPEIDVFNNIMSYSNQVDKLFVFDNSDIMNDFFINKITGIENVIYYSENKNMGVGYAMNYGACNARENGYKYLLTMDQDSFACQDLVDKLMQAFSDRPNTGIAAPFFQNKFSTKTPPKEMYTELFSSMTSGNLLDLAAYNKIGKFRDDYFIDYIDIEYCFRLKHKGYQIIQVNSVILDHNEANITRKHFLFRKIFPYNNAPVRFYYKTRNYFYFEKEYARIFPAEIRTERKFFLKNIIKMVLFEKKRVKKIKMIYAGFIDYKKNIKGRFAI